MLTSLIYDFINNNLNFSMIKLLIITSDGNLEIRFLVVCFCADLYTNSNSVKKSYRVIFGGQTSPNRPRKGFSSAEGRFGIIYRGTGCHPLSCIFNTYLSILNSRYFLFIRKKCISAFLRSTLGV